MVGHLVVLQPASALPTAGLDFLVLVGALASLRQVQVLILVRAQCRHPQPGCGHGRVLGQGKKTASVAALPLPVPVRLNAHFTLIRFILVVEKDLLAKAWRDKIHATVLRFGL